MYELILQREENKLAEKKEQAKLNAALKGLTGVTEIKQPDSLREQVSQQHVLMTGLYDPPTYFVFMLMRAANFTAYSDWDKSRWQFYVQYKDIHFCIRDWKMSAWSIDALEMSIDKEGAMKIAEELRARIVKTGRNLEKFLQPELQKFIEENNYALPNPYRHLRNLYDYFRDQVQEAQNKTEFAENTDPKDLDVEAIAVEKTNVFSLDEVFEEQKLQESKPLESSEGLEKEQENIEKFFKSMVDNHNKKLELERIASYNACAMVSFFFSYIEFLMDTLHIFYPVAALPKKPKKRPFYSFSHRLSWIQRVIRTVSKTSRAKTPTVNMTLHDFKERSWRERFNAVFPVKNDKGLERIYRKLLEIRDGWRNVIEHGFRSKEEALLIPLPGLGLIPISYTSASKAIHFAITPSPKNGIQEALDAFLAFDTWATDNQQTACIITFAQHSDVIPLMEKRLQEIREWMSSLDTLKESLKAEDDELQSWLDHYQ